MGLTFCVPRGFMGPSRMNLACMRVHCSSGSMGPSDWDRCTCGTHGTLATGPCTRVLGTRPALGGSAVNKIEILFCNKIEIHRHKLVVMQSGPALWFMGPTRAFRVPKSSMLPSLIKMRVVAQGASHPPPLPLRLSLSL